MKYHLIFIFFLEMLFACNNGNRLEKNPKSITYQINDSTILDTGSYPVADKIIKIYTDSINNATDGNNLPEFLKNSQFDYQMAGFFSSSHRPTSLRKLILEKVEDCKGLNLIISSGQSLYKKKPYKEHDIELEFAEYSFYDLVIRRAKELKCI